MTFYHPSILLLLLLLIPIVWWYVRHQSHKEMSFRSSTVEPFKGIRPTLRTRLRHLPFVLRMVALAMLIIALARPQSSFSWQNRTKEGIDILLSMDVSPSMLATDLKPNRLEAAKTVATEFIRNRPDDNIGLVLFSGESFLYCPLTNDHSQLISLMSSAGFDLIGVDGTAIGLGLGNAVSRLKTSQAKSKVVILLTDGTNNSGDISPETAADIAAAMGVRVYAIGVGTRGKAMMPMDTPIGIQYVPMDVDIDEGMLKSIARKTGGKYFRATDNQSLQSIYAEIDKMEKTKLEVRDFSKKNEAYLPFALLALFCLLSEIILRKTWLNRMP